MIDFLDTKTEQVGSFYELECTIRFGMKKLSEEVKFHDQTSSPRRCMEQHVTSKNIVADGTTRRIRGAIMCRAEVACRDWTKEKCKKNPEGDVWQGRMLNKLTQTGVVDVVQGVDQLGCNTWQLLVKAMM